MSYECFAWQAGLFADEAGDAEAGEMFLEMAQELGASFGGELEVACALDGIEAMEVVGDDSVVDEGRGEGEERVFVVIDAFEENRLVEDGDAQHEDFFQGGGDIGIEFAGVVDVDDEKDLFGGGGQQFEERGVDALGDADGEAGVEADPFEVGNGVEGLKKVGERAIA